MITKVEFLKCFGIFHDFISDKSLHEFSKFNLFYGWNGCGKSTISRLFASIEHKKIDDDFKGCSFKIATEGSIITESNISTNSIVVRVFNQDFIKANIQWDNHIKSILVIAEEKIEERNKWEALKKEIAKVSAEVLSVEIDNENLNKQVNLFYSSSAKIIKESLKIIDTSDTYYFNYDKTKLEKFINANSVEVIDPASILSEENKHFLIQSIQPIQKNEIAFSIPTLKVEHYQDARTRIKSILIREVVANVISRLLDNPEINLWVKAGLSLHKDSGVCEFCEQSLPSGRIKVLNAHFNDAYQEIIDNIKNAIEWLDSFCNSEISFPDVNIFYDEFVSEYLAIKAEILVARKELQKLFFSWKQLLEKKDENPFQFFEIPDDELEDSLINYNGKIGKLINLVEKHNIKTKNFSNDLKAKKFKLELHYAAEAVQNSEFNNWKIKIKENGDAIKNLRDGLATKSSEEKRLETLLVNEAKGAEQFNTYLHRFLGRTDISLKFNKEAKGYNILRGKSSKVAKNLSEGEKTAIAFVYFVIKLKERGNKIEDTIVVVDDPISSFDSNHLFHSYSFLKNSCEQAKQLFVFTHNFQYYRLIRDWFDKKNKKDWKDGKQVEKIRSRFFAIESKIEVERASSIKNAHESLQKYNSEYHYVFHKMFSYQNDNIDALDKAYLIGNLCRKLLEGFLTFKFPKARKDFRSLMEDSCADKEQLERIYRFINKYSHNQLIEFHDTPVDNLISEGNEIVKDVFQLVKTLDEKHYEEMNEICN